MDIKKKLLSTKLGQMAVDRYGIANLTALGTGIVILVVIGMVGIYIASEIHNIAGITTGSVFYTASMKVINVMNTGWGLILIAVLALIAGIVIAYLTGGFEAGGRGGGGT